VRTSYKCDELHSCTRYKCVLPSISETFGTHLYPVLYGISQVGDVPEDHSNLKRPPPLQNTHKMIAWVVVVVLLACQGAASSLIRSNGQLFLFNALQANVKTVEANAANDPIVLEVSPKSTNGLLSFRLVGQPVETLLDVSKRAHLPHFTNGFQVRFNEYDVEATVNLLGVDIRKDRDARVKRYSSLHESCLFLKEMVGSHLGECSNGEVDFMWSYLDQTEKNFKKVNAVMRNFKNFTSSEDLTYFAQGTPLRSVRNADMIAVKLRGASEDTVKQHTIRSFDLGLETVGYVRWEGKVKGWVRPLIDRIVEDKFGKNAELQSAYLHVLSLEENDIMLTISVDVDVPSSFQIQLKDYDKFFALQGSGQYEDGKIYSISSGVKVSKIEAAAPSYSSKTSFVRMERQLSNDAISTKVVTSVYFPRSFKYYDQNCSVAIVDHIPEGVFADPDELRKVQGYQFDIQNEVHIERPSFMSQHNTVAAVRTGVTLSGWVNFSLPIHFRYQHPSSSSKFRNVKLLRSSVSVSCPVPKGCGAFFSVWGTVAQEVDVEHCPNWENVPVIWATSTSETYITKEVPVGDSNLTFLVNAITLGFSGLGVLAIALAIVSKPTDKLKGE
jgi:hypothetical protein